MLRAGHALRFLGVGGSQAEGLGSAAAVLERAGRPVLLIDCGPGTPARYLERYATLPHALFVTHVHLDHVGGLEALGSRLALEPRHRPVKLYAPVPIVAGLHERVATLAFPLAEGRANFWDAFQLVPVADGFWHEGLWFDVFEARHHAPRFCWGLRLAGQFVYTGDTRPIPEVLRHHGRRGERLFHDCAFQGNPSHTGWDDLVREYEPELRRRMVLYHYESETAGARLRALGARVARPGEAFRLDLRPVGEDPRRDGPDLRVAG